MNEGERNSESFGNRRSFILFLSIVFLFSLSVSFGTGFFVGKRSLAQPETEVQITESAEKNIAAVSSDIVEEKVIPSSGDASIAENIPQEPPGLILVSQEMGEDAEGLFIFGTVKNVSGNDYDVVQVEFDLCDNQEHPYHVLKEKTTEGLRNNDSWGFTLYVPYTEREKFASYHLRSLSGARMGK